MRIAGEDIPSIYETHCVKKDGTQFWIENYISVIDWEGEKAVQSAMIDITERKNIEGQLKHMAYHDALTGLPDRNAFETQLDDELNRAIRYKHALSLLILDLDHFKSINDVYGHQAGDKILRSFSMLLEQVIRNTDFAGRYGGEEFIIILPETTLSEAEELAERMRKKIEAHTFTISDDKKIKVTSSIGIASFPDHAQTKLNLIRAADSSMYKAKEAGRNQVKIP